MPDTAPTMLSLETGKAVKPSDPTKAFVEGKAAFVKGSRVPFTDGSQVFTVDESEASKAIDAGARVATPEQVRRARIQAEHGGVSGMAGAFGQKAVDVATFGLGAEPLLHARAALGGRSLEEQRRVAREQIEANPLAAGAGTAVGLVAPLLVPGAGEATGAKALAGGAEVGLGAARAAEAGSVAGRAAAGALEAGRASELLLPGARSAIATRGAEGIGAFDAAKARQFELGGLPEVIGEQVGSTGLTRAQQGGLGSFDAARARAFELGGLPEVAGEPVQFTSLARRVVGAPAKGVYGFGGQTERSVAAAIQSLGGENRLANAIARAGGTGARWGVEGAAFGAADALEDAALTGHYDDIGEQIASHALKAGGIGAAMGAGGSALGSLSRAAALSAAEHALGVVGEGATREAMASKLREMAGSSMFKAMSHSASSKAVEKAETTITGGVQGVADTLLRRGHLPKVGLTPSPAAIAESTAKDLEGVGEEVGKIARAATEAGGEIAVRPFVERAFQEVIAPLATTPGMEGVSRVVSRYVKSVVKHAGGAEASVPVEKMWEWRRGLDRLIYPGGGQPKSIAAKELSSIRGIIEDEVTQAIDRVADKTGFDAAAWTDAKTAFQHLKFANKEAEKATAKVLGNRELSWSDMQLGSIAGLGGALSGHGPLGIATGLAAAVANKLVREQGRAIRANLLDRMASVIEVGKFVSRADADAIKGINGIFSSRALAEQRVAVANAARGIVDKGDRIEAMKAVQRQVAEAKADPDSFRAKVYEGMGALSVHTPHVVAAAAATAERSVLYLASKLPQQFPPSDLLTPGLDKPRADPLAEAAFDTAYRAVSDPHVLIHDMHTGTLSPETVQAVKVTRPKFYASVSMAVMQKLSTLNTPLPYAKARQVGILLERPATGIDTPQFGASMMAGAPRAPSTPRLPTFGSRRAPTTANAFALHNGSRR